MIFSPVVWKIGSFVEFIRNFRLVCGTSPFEGTGPVCRTDPVCGSYIYIKAAVNSPNDIFFKSISCSTMQSTS